MTALQPGHYAGGDVRIRKAHHCWRYDQDPRLWVSTCIAVIYARKFGIAVIRGLPVRNAKRKSTVTLLIACNVGGYLEQIRETVNTGRLHAWVEHNPNFIGSACRRGFLLLARTKNCHLSLSRFMHRSRFASLSLA